MLTGSHEMGTRVRIAVNVLTNWIAFILGAAIALVLTPLVVHSLGDVRYGLWSVIGTMVGYLGLLDIGVRVGVTRFVARYHATGDQVAVNRLMSTALGMFVVLGALAILLGLLLALLLPRVIQIPVDLVGEVSVAVAIGGVTVAIALVGGVFGGSIAGLQRFALMNAIDLGVEVARALAVVVVLGAGGGLIGLSLVQLVALGTRGALHVVANRRLQPGLRLALTLCNTTMLTTILRYSAYTTVLHVCAIIIFSSDAVVIAALMPVAQVTFFMIGASLCRVVLQVLGGASRALFPLVSARQATDGTRGTTSLVRDSVRLSTLVVMPIVLTLLFRGTTFIGLWIGPAYAGPSGHVLQILAVGLCVFASYQVFASALMALNLHRGLMIPFVFEAVANIGLSVVLGTFLGIIGVAWGTTLPRAAMALTVGPWFAKRKLGLGIHEYAVHAWVRPLAAMAPFAAASVLVDREWPAPGLVVFFAQVALTLPVAAMGAWFVGLEPRERATIRAAGRGMLEHAKLVARSAAGRA